MDSNTGLVDLLSRYYRYKWVLCGIVFIGCIAGVLTALSVPKVYTSDALVRVVANDSGGDAISGLGGLASIAGLGSGSDSEFQAKYAIEVIYSRSFLQELLKHHDIRVDLVAVYAWNAKQGDAIYDEDVYDPSAEGWLIGEETGAGKEPPFHLVYSKYKKIIDLAYDKTTSTVKFKVTHPSPIFSAKLITLIIEQANKSLKKEKVVEAEANIAYIQNELDKTSVSSMRSVLIKLLVEQKRMKMLAEVKREYVFATIDPPVVPPVPSGPSSPLIVILACILSFVFGLLILAVWFIRVDYIRENYEASSRAS